MALLLSCVQAGAQEFTPRNTQAAGQHPLAPAEAISRLRVPDGFQITLAAAEPEVRQPIAITFDDRGRLWVAESYSYDGSTFTDQPHDRILIFEDTNGDGVLDWRKVFCEGLTHLTGLELGFGGVWITAPPHLAFLPDADHDDVPDGEAVVHLDGWSLKAEHNSVNGLTWGPDGWLYGRHGIKQPSRVGRPGDAIEERVELSCSIWRYHPTDHRFEVVADGTINPWGLDFNDHGQGFLTTSVVEHLWHLVPGAHYQRWKDRGVHPNPHVYETMTATSDHLHWSSAKAVDQHNASTLDFGGGHSHCDAMIYLGDRWPQSYRGSLLTSNIHGRRINRDRLVRDDGPFRGVHADDFLVARDPWFRAVSMEYGPDGDVYVTDWSDNGECHDRDGVHRTSGRIYKITWGKPIRVDVDLGQATDKQLVAFQLHANDWFVRHARRILQERDADGDDLSEAHAALRDIFHRHPDDTRKLRALWALHSSGGIDDHWLSELLSHDNEHVRCWAVRLLVDDATLSRATYLARFAEMAETETSWLVRMALASALQRIDIKQRWAIAVELATKDDGATEPNLERMIWYAIEPVIVANSDRALDAVESFPQKIRRWMARRIGSDSTRSASLLLDHLAHTTRADVIADLLEGFNDSVSVKSRDEYSESVGNVIETLIEHDDRRVRVAAVRAAAVTGGESGLRRVRQQLHAAETDRTTRQAALDGLARRNPAGFARDLERLIVSSRLTTAALRAATKTDDRKLAETVLSRFGELEPNERVAALDYLVARRRSAARLLSAIESKTIAAAELSAGQSRQIDALGDKALQGRLHQVWGTLRRSPAERVHQIKDLEKRLDPSRIATASLSRGRELFQKTCASCHKLFGDGKSVGPELTGANRRDLHYLVSNIIDPSAAVPADFRLSNLLTTDGRVMVGSVVRQTDSSTTIQTATETVELPTDTIETIQLTSKSLMPDGLLDSLSQQQIQDLFAWLMSNGH
ncbi:PVC-type heme-binding CxxCH protein [Stieleria neptunia]|uniref:PVC-type heme-binding CxxCH protein n=1 Tax=Stieleria neptunia TaxID=2527979 RepID=UPI0011A4CDE4|nr:PVC-type heme-binding CxxCH protein [Stieleria neptunia]